MADTEKLILELSAKVDKYNANMRSARQMSSRDMRKMQAEIRNTERSVDRFSKNAGRVLMGFAATAASALSTREIIRYGDTWNRVQNRLRTVTNNQNELMKATSGVTEVAKDSWTDLEATATLYQRIARSTEDLGIKQKEIIELTRTINKAFVIGGATNQEAAASVIQLSQAFSRGVLRGDEFRSVSEQAPVIMEAIMEATGSTRGELIEYAEQGKLTSEVVIKSLQNYQAEVERTFGRTQRTIGAALTISRTDITEFIGRIDDAQGFTEWFTEAVTGASGALSDMVEPTNRVIDSFRIWVEEWDKVFGGGSQEDLARYVDEYKRQMMALQSFTSVTIDFIEDSFLQMPNNIFTVLQILGVEVAAAEERMKVRTRGFERNLDEIGNMWTDFKSLITGGGKSVSESIDDELKDVGSSGSIINSFKGIFTGEESISGIFTKQLSEQTDKIAGVFDSEKSVVDELSGQLDKRQSSISNMWEGFKEVLSGERNISESISEVLEERQNDAKEIFSSFKDMFTPEKSIGEVLSDQFHRSQMDSDAEERREDEIDQINTLRNQKVESILAQRDARREAFEERMEQIERLREAGDPELQPFDMGDLPKKFEEKQRAIIDLTEDTEKDKSKLILKEEKWRAKIRKSFHKDTVSLLHSLAGENKTASQAVFLVDQALAANEAFVSGEAAQLRALAELGPVAGPPVAAAIKAKTALSIAAIAAATVSSFPSSGGGGGNIGGTGGAAVGGDSFGGDIEDFETSNLTVSGLGSGSAASGSQQIMFSATAGDDLGEVLSEWLNDQIKKGRINT